MTTEDDRRTRALATLQNEASSLARLLNDADPALSIAAAAARRLAGVSDLETFHTNARQLAGDIDDLRASRRQIDALFRWSNNPVDAGYALARRAAAAHQDRCEIDPESRPCDGPRTLTLAVWTEDGLAEAWEPLCARHALDYAQQWDPRDAELVISGDPAHARQVIIEMISAHPGDTNIRTARPGEDTYGRKQEEPA